MLPTLTLALLLLAAAAMLGTAAHRWPRPVLQPALLLACGAALGFVWAGLLAQQRLAHALPDDWEGRDVTLIGTIDSLPYRFDQGVRFNLALEQCCKQTAACRRQPICRPKSRCHGMRHR